MCTEGTEGAIWTEGTAGVTGTEGVERVIGVPEPEEGLDGTRTDGTGDGTVVIYGVARAAGVGCEVRGRGVEI
jgi:hypothetical protein